MQLREEAPRPRTLKIEAYRPHPTAEYPHNASTPTTEVLVRFGRTFESASASGREIVQLAAEYDGGKGQEQRQEARMVEAGADSARKPCKSCGRKRDEVSVAPPAMREIDCRRGCGLCFGIDSNSAISNLGSKRRPSVWRGR